MSYALFIDDERFPVEDGRDWEIARTMNDVSEIIARRGAPGFISFDHDLGENEPTGYDIAKALVEADISAREGGFSALGNSDAILPASLDFRFLQGFRFYVHSQNPVGARNIQLYLEGYLNLLGRD